MMKWEKLLIAERLGNKPAKQFDGRSPFLSDHDKIIFSQAFRRLGRKTQVHPLASNDHIHNRMTHSLEVACIGRSLALQVGYHLRDKHRLPDEFLPSALGDIVQSTCLAHDIGNPPFGHTGEAAIGKWFKRNADTYLKGLSTREQNDLLYFEGNAQGFRILTASGNNKESSILSMTYATLSAFIKYPWASDTQQAQKKHKYGIFSTEQNLMDEIGIKAGLLTEGEGYCRHPLVYLMEAADDFCYGMLDLEDGVEMKLISFDDIYDIFSPILTAGQKGMLSTKMQMAKKGREPGLLRGLIMDLYIREGVETFIANEAKILSGNFEGDLIAHTSASVSKSVQQAKNVARDKIFSHPRKVELEIGAYEIIYNILDKIVPAIKDWHTHGGARDKENDMVIRLMGENNLPETGSFYECLMAGLDFVSGMTDNYAAYLSKQFSGFGHTH